MDINITSGERLNKILTKKHPNDLFIPFNEAMIEGSYQSNLFSEEFIVERANTHNVSVSEYKAKLKDFLILLENPNKYGKIYLWFGDEPFCRENRKTVIESLSVYGYKGEIINYIVDEIKGEIL